MQAIRPAAPKAIHAAGDEPTAQAAQGSSTYVDPKDSYWRRQLYFASSIGIFYIIIIALFGIPLLGTFVVILIKGALDLRYLIIAGGCVGAIALGWFILRVFRQLWQRMRRDGALASEGARRNLLMGKPIEISIFNGMLKFSCGHPPSDTPLALPHADQALLPQQTGQPGVHGILDQLTHLAELKRSGAIDDDEFNLLKSMLIESSAANPTTKNDLS